MQSVSEYMPLGLRLALDKTVNVRRACKEAQQPLKSGPSQLRPCAVGPKCILRYLPASVILIWPQAASTCWSNLRTSLCAASSRRAPTITISHLLGFSFMPAKRPATRNGGSKVDSRRAPLRKTAASSAPWHSMPVLPCANTAWMRRPIAVFW